MSLGTAALGLVALAGARASAQQADVPSTWIGTTSNYATATNWSVGEPTMPGQSALFNGAGSAAVNLADGSTVTPDGFRFTGNTAYTVTVSGGSVLRLGAVGLTNNSTQTQTLVLGGGTLALPGNATGANTVVRLMAAATPDAIEAGAYGGTVTGSGDLTKTTAGTLVLGGANNGYTGATIVLAGTLDVSGAITQSSALQNNAAFVVAPGGAATFGTITNAGTLTNGGALTSNGSFANQAGATLASTGVLSTGTLANAGTADLAGTLNQVSIANAAGGSIVVTGALGGSSNLSNAAGAAVTVGANSYTGIGTLTNAGSLTVGSGTLSATTVANQAGATFASAGTLSAVSLNNAGSLQLAGTLNVPSLVNTGALTVTGPLGGSSNVTNAAGATIAVGANSFSGIGTLTNGGTVTVGSGALSAQTVANQNGASLSGAGQLAVGTLSNSGAVNLSGTLNATAVNNAATFTVAGALGGTTNAFNNAAGASLEVGGGSFSGIGTLSNAGAVAVGSGALTAGVINDAAGSTLTSGGSVTATTINNAGAAALSGTLTAGTVNNTASVTVTGALGGTTGAFNNASGASLAVGANSFGTVGTLTNAGSVMVGSGALTAGTILNQAGTLTSAGTLNATTLTNAATANLAGTLNAATVNNTAAFNVTGSLAGTIGTFNQQSGTFDLGGNTVAMGTLSLTGGSVADGTVRANLFALQQGTVSASLAGAGSLTKTGPGLVVLSSVNGYTGPTTISAGQLSLAGAGAIAASSGVRDDAVLSIAGTAAGASIRSLSGSGQVLLGGQTLTLTAAAGTFSGQISGSGGLVLQAGQETLTGASSYAGGTVVQGGTLAIGDAGAIGSGTLRLDRGTTLAFVAPDIDLANAVLLANRRDPTVDTGAFSDAISGVVAGPGHLTKTGSGQLTLSASNRYTGGTTVAAGTLVGSAASFGPGAIADAGTLVIDQNADAAFANAVSGAGALIKSGSAALDLIGQSTLSGPTTVQSGTLIVDGSLAASTVTLERGTVLAGTGTVGGFAALANATVQPGLRRPYAQLSATGAVSFAPGSTFRVAIDAIGDNAKVVAGGTGTITGGTVDVVAAGGIYNPAARYTLLTAQGGVSGRFADLTTTSNLAFLDPFLIYGPRTVVLAFAQQPFLSVATTPNQTAAAGALQSLGPAAFTFVGTGNTPGGGATGVPNYNAAALYYALLGQNRAGAAQALDVLSGEIHASAVTAALEDNRFVREGILNQLHAEADANGGFDGAAGGGAGGGAARTARSPYGTWGQGFGDFGTNGRDRNAATLGRSLGGFVLGADGRLPTFLGPWSLGFAGAYTSDAIDVARRASSGTVESFTAGLYAGTRYGALDVNLGAVGGGLRTDLGRTIAFPGFLDAARSSYGGTIAQGFGEAGYRFGIAQGFVEPLFTAAAIHIDQDGFVEKGGAAALVGAGRGYDLGTTTLGIRSERALSAADPIFAHAFLGWRHAFGDVRPGTLASFASGSSAFTVEGVPIDRDALSVQAGLDWKPADGFTLAALYSGQVGARAQDHAVKGQLEYHF